MRVSRRRTCDSEKNYCRILNKTMVFLSVLRYARNKGPDEFWRKRKVFKLTAHFYGRKRNCYSLAIRGLHKAMQKCIYGRQQKKLDYRELWMKRVDAGAVELDTRHETVMEGLVRCHIALNHKVMSELAVYEPRTFEALAKIGQTKMYQEKRRGLNQIDEAPTGIITRGML